MGNLTHQDPILPPTQDAAHSKHGGSEGDCREQELYKEELCVDKYRTMAS